MAADDHAGRRARGPRRRERRYGLRMHDLRTCSVRALASLAASVLLAAAPLAGRAAAQATDSTRPEADAAACSNGQDDDRDGLADCADPACAVHAFCSTVARHHPRRALEPRTRSLVPLQIAGVVTWLVVYGVGVGVTAAVGGSGYEIGLNAVPLAGPWLCFGLCERPEPYAAGLITSGAVQLAGLVMLVIGSAISVEVHEPEALALVPWLGDGTAGATFTIRL